MAQDSRKCLVIGCEAATHSGGLCRRHYLLKWRKERGLGQRRQNKHKVDDDPDPTIILKLRQAHAAYDCACGLKAQLLWRSEIAELENTIRGVRR
jgi:hypothetical protein